MRVLYPGHSYQLDHLDGSNLSILQFVQREPHHEPKEGTTCQEVIRALIDRVEVLNEELPWEGNAKILANLRESLVLFECRALLRKVEKGELKPEDITVEKDGHFKLTRDR